MRGHVNGDRPSCTDVLTRGPGLPGRALRHPNFRLLWMGALVSGLGTWTQDVALAWLIHTQLQQPFYLGLRSFAAEAPLLAFMLLGGAVADRFDRRRVLLAAQGVQMLLALVLAGLYATDRLTIAAILTVAVLTGLTQSQSAPTYQAVITSVVPRSVIPNAVALNSLQFNVTRAVGPVIGGVLLTHGGAGLCFGANAISFTAVILALLRVTVPSPRQSGGTLRQSLGAGFEHVRGQPLLLTLTLLAFAASFLGYPLITYLPVLAADVLGIGAGGYSFLLSSFGAGAVVGALVTAWRGSVAGRGRIIAGCGATYGVSVVAAVYCGRLWWTAGLLLLAGAALTSASLLLTSLVQENSPDLLRGRVMSIYGLAFRGGMPLGSLVAGFFVGPWGAPAVLALFCGSLAVLALAAYSRSATLRAL